MPSMRRIAPALTLLLMGMVKPAWAHPGSAEVAGTASVSVLPAVVLVAAVAALVCGGARRWQAGTIAGLLVLCAYEGAIHSVHHLGDPAGQKRCAVEAGSSNLNAVPSAPIDVGRCLVSGEATVPLGPAVFSRRVPGTERPRAPPPSA